MRTLDDSDRRPERWRWLRTDVVLTAVATGVLVWIAGPILLLIFAGILLAVVLDGLARLLAKIAPWPRGLRLGIVVIALGLLLATGAVTIAPQIAGEMQGVWRQVSRIASDIRAVIEQHPWVMEALGQAEESEADQGEEQGAEDAQEEALRAVPDVSAQIASLVTALIGGIATAVVMIAIGLFLAVDPGLYVRGAIKLVPIARRARAAEVLATIGYALRWWLIGQLVSMTVLGVVTSAGLMFFGVELWLGLGLLTALLTFVPFLGPIIAGVPVLLIAFAEGAQTGIAVLIFYLVLQNVEGFLLTPLVQQRAVRLPPALLIAMQVLMGALFGIAGLLVAAPLTAAGMIAVNLLYIEGVLGDTPATPKRRIRPRYEGLP